jgi:hypothetical protein
MKSLVAGIVLIILIGIGGFIYRNVQERTGGPSAVACTEEARVCPDGSSVGRSGPACEFAPCAFPNVAFADAKIALAVPTGYVVGVQEPGADGELPGMLAFYQKPAGDGSSHFITLYEYAIPEGKTAEDVILANTVFSPSGENAKDMKEFKPVLIDGRTFQGVVIERFEGQVASSYYLAREKSVLRFDVIERDVKDWTDPKLVVGNLPEHKALLQMLSTLTLN